MSVAALSGRECHISQTKKTRNQTVVIASHSALCSRLMEEEDAHLSGRRSQSP